MNGVEGSRGVPSVSGGDVRIITILKQWSADHTVILSTNAMGMQLAKQHGLNAAYLDIGVPSGTGIFPNVMKVLKALSVTPKQAISVSYSGGEHLYDVIAPAFLKLFRRTPWVAVVHWVEEYPWNDKRGGTPFVHRYLYWLNRVLAMQLIKMLANHILAVSESTRDKIVQKRNVPRSRVSAVLCGLDVDAARSTRALGNDRLYDAVFMKRLNFGKGVRDLVDIWARVVKLRPDARLQIIGDGPPSVVNEINDRISAHGIAHSIDLVGVVHDQSEKYRRLGNSKLFILPSHEENWAIVIGEALAAGLPVIAYALKELVPIWGTRVTWIEFGELDKFAEEIIRQLNCPRPAELDTFLLSLDWNAIASQELRHLTRALPVEKN